MDILNLDELLTTACHPMKPGEACNPAAIARQLSVLPAWVLDVVADAPESAALTRTYSFKNYYQTLAFVNGIAWMIHQQDHHPELKLSYNRCTVRFNTHSVGGISLNDFICAARCDALYGQAV